MRPVAKSQVPRVKGAVFARHPAMSKWPPSHDFFFATLDVTALWLIDFYGGAANIDPSDYYAIPALDTPPPHSTTPPPAMSMADEPRAHPADAPVSQSIWRDGPPPGSNTSAICPVTAKAINITDATPSLAFKNGQKLYFASAAASATYRASPRDYWLAPHDLPLAGADGARGLPDLRGQVLHCPMSGEAINVSMKSIRIDQNHGQAIYFCCHGCVSAFWRNPSALFA